MLIFFYFTIDSEKVPPQFSKQECRHPDIPDLVLSYYKGDHLAYKPKPHGNRLHGDQEHRRTASSVLTKANDTSKGPSATYRELITDPSISNTFPGVFNPRNQKQVRNQAQQRQIQQ